MGSARKLDEPVAGTRKMRKRGNPGTHRKAKPESRKQGNLEIRPEATLKDGEREETRRTIAGRAGRCRIQGDLKTALRGEAGQLKTRCNPGICNLRR